MRDRASGERVVKDWYLVAYDVRDAKRLRRVARILEGYGHRLQYSVFRCHLTARNVERLRWELLEEMTDDDELLIVPLCTKCVARIRVRNRSDQWPENPPDWVIV